MKKLTHTDDGLYKNTITAVPVSFLMVEHFRMWWMCIMIVVFVGLKEGVSLYYASFHVQQWLMGTNNLTKINDKNSGYNKQASEKIIKREKKREKWRKLGRKHSQKTIKGRKTTKKSEEIALICYINHSIWLIYPENRNCFTWCGAFNGFRLTNAWNKVFDHDEHWNKTHRRKKKKAPKLNTELIRSLTRSYYLHCSVETHWSEEQQQQKNTKNCASFFFLQFF